MATLQHLSPGLFAAVEVWHTFTHVCLISFPSLICIFQSIQEMGNTKARQLYEANLPDSFRRPQTDQYPSSWEHLDKWLVRCYALSGSFSLILIPELWNSSSGINMRRRNTTARKWPTGAVYAPIHLESNFVRFTQLTVFGFLCQPRDAKKERDADRGSRASSYSKVSNSPEFLDEEGNVMAFLYALFSQLQSFWRVKSRDQFRKLARLKLQNLLSTC